MLEGIFKGTSSFALVIWVYFFITFHLSVLNVLFN